MDSGKDLNNVAAEIQTLKRKRRFSATAELREELAKNDGDENGKEPCEQALATTLGDGANGAPAAKYREVEQRREFNLTHFSDEMLFEIFKHLDTWTLLALMNTCDRFHLFVLDHRFWVDIDLGHEPLPLGIIEDVLERTNINTVSIKLRGPPPSQHVDSEIRQFNKTVVTTFDLHCTNLRVLEFQGVTIDFGLLNIRAYPKRLKRLVFHDCNARMMDTNKSVFSEIETNLAELEEMGIEFCDWFDPFYICSFSKLPELRWLSFKGCQSLVEFIPYGSMSARFGFRRLEHLDMRFTPITDSDLQCFNAVKTLKEILLDCPEHLRNDDDGRTARQSNDTIIEDSEIDVTTEDDDAPSTSTSRGRSHSNSDNSSPSSSNSNSSSAASSRSSSNSNSPPSPQANADAVATPRATPPPRNIHVTRHGPDQVIYLDLHNRRRPIIMNGPIRRPINNANHLEQVLNHPLFWNIIDAPLPAVHGRGNGRSNEDGDPGTAGSAQRRSPCLFFNRNSRHRFPISDRGICCLSRPQHPVDQGVIWIRIGNRPSGNRFERLTVRNYKLVTDISLQNLVQSSPNLSFLDLTGTSVTREGVQHFKELKPECQVIADHLNNNDESKDVAAPSAPTPPIQI